MDGKVYDLLQQIQNELKQKNARIGLSRPVREFIIRISLDSDYYNNISSVIGVDDLVLKLQTILDNLKPINEKLESFNNQDLDSSKNYKALIDEDVVSMEEKKDELLRQLVLKEIEEREILKKELDDKNKYSNIISEFKK